MTEITLEKIGKSYGAAKIIEGLDLKIESGTFLVLVGPSGCGKSTLLRMIAGLENITSGNMRIDGTVSNGLSAKERDFAMVFQSYALYPHMTVRDNLGFSLKMRGWKKSEVEPAVQKVAETLQLGANLSSYPRQLSGGQRQRVAMGRTIIRKPRLFLFDEPLSNLDAKLRVQMRAEIKALYQRLKTTSVYVTHDQMEAMTLADEIVVMNAGKIVQKGKPLELYDRPTSRFVAEFIGSPGMNFITAHAKSGSGKPTFEMAGAPDNVIIVDDLQSAVETGKEVWIGVRPEDAQVSAPEANGSIPLTVEVVEPTGAETLIYGRIGNDIPFCVLTKQRIHPPIGAIIHVSLDTEKLHLFDSGTGFRL